MYMARAPGSVVNWNGAGNVWFKIFEEGGKVDNTGVHFHTGTIPNASLRDIQAHRCRPHESHREDSEERAKWRISCTSRARRSAQGRSAAVLRRLRTSASFGRWRGIAGSKGCISRSVQQVLAVIHVQHVLWGNVSWPQQGRGAMMLTST
jgi:hypothetical protein